MSNITVRYHHNHKEMVAKDIPPTFRAIADLLHSSVSLLRIRIHSMDELEVMSPHGEGLLVKFNDFKEVKL